LSEKFGMKRFVRSPVTAVLLAICLFSLPLGLVYLHLTSPFDGARLGPDEPFGESAWKADGILATPLQDEGTGLQKNDLIVAVDGISVEAWVQALASPDIERPQWKPDQVIIYSVVRNGTRQDIPVRLRTYPLDALLKATGPFPLVVLIFQFVAICIFWRRPDDSAAWSLALWASCGSIIVATLSIGLQMSDIVGAVGFWLFKATFFFAFIVGAFGAVRFALLFPQPHPLLLRHRFVPWLVYGAPAAVYTVYLLVMRYQAPSLLAWIGIWNSSWVVSAVIYMIMVISTLVLNHLRTRYIDAVARQQGRLVVFSMAAAAGLGVGLGLIPRIVLGYSLVDRNTLALFPLFFVIAITVAILRYHLFEIDLVINRTLVYALLTSAVVVIYTLTVGLLGTLFQASGNIAVSLLATGLVGLLFHPLRLRLQRAVNRLMYGERDDPYSVLARLGQRLETTLVPDAVLPTIVETIAQALKLPYTAITLKQGVDFAEVAAFGLLKGNPLRIPLAYQGETLGQLILAPRSPGEPFTPVDLRLLEGLAHQVGTAVHAARLTIDLQHSREQLVTAREEERRRLRRDLHDGLGQALASQALQLDAASNLVKREPDGAQTLLSDLKAQTQRAIADIRRLVYELRPPALDELGLVSALREQIGQIAQLNGLQVVLEAPDRLPPLSAAVEVAAYRIALEALTNVARHAQARRCTIRLTLDPWLCLEIVDDGCGIPVSYRAGVGLTSMRERAAELGGTCLVQPAPSSGTHILVRLPLPKEMSS
jgi:signal transduction histidine kinase